jgi:hypothetical protein
MELIYASGVLEEVSESAKYYEDEVDGLGKAFVGKVQDGVAEIKENPLMYRIIKGDFRRHLLNRFPFAVIYRIESQKIYILAVMHLRRKPYYWISRDKSQP